MLTRQLLTLPDMFERKRFIGPLDIRAPEDRFVTEEKPAEDTPIWSPAIHQAMVEWYDAKQQDDRDALKDAAQKIVEATSAYYRIRGVPVFAHDPLPPQFVAAEIGNAHAEVGAHPATTIDRFINSFDNSVKPGIDQQVRDHLAGSDEDGGYGSVNSIDRPNSSAASARSAPGALPSEQPGTKGSAWRMPLHAPEHTEATPMQTEEADARARRGVSAVHSFDPRGDQPELVQMQYAQPGLPRNQPRIVKSYRRSPSPDMAREDQEADETARDADVSIRQLVYAIGVNGAFRADRDQLIQQFLAALKRYYSEGGERAVVAAGTKRKSISAGAKDRYASYDGTFDRIAFTNEFKGLSHDAKIVTIIHEILHATLMIKNVEARSGYNRDRQGGMLFAQHEAILDNIAIAYAKRLKLISQDYPPSSWQQYYWTEEEMRNRP